jgi:tetratricopeptide (TPR) repeat protein
MAEETPPQRHRICFEGVDQFCGPFGRRANAQRSAAAKPQPKGRPTRTKATGHSRLRHSLGILALVLGVAYWLIWMGIIDMDGARAAVLNRVAGIYPEYARANALLSKDYGTSALMRKDRLRACEQLVQAHPDDPLALVLLGDAYLGEDDLRQARICYDKALDLEPNCFEAYVALGKLHSEQNEYEQAEAAYQQALAIRPESSDVHVALGLLYSSQGRYEQAMLAFHRGGKTAPEVNEVEIPAEQADAKPGFYEKAIASFKDALGADDKSAQAHFNLGRAYLQSGDRDLALQQHRKLEAIDPKLAAKLLKLINQSR